MAGKIETDSEALDYRIYAHKHFSKFDFDKWVMDQLQLEKGMNVLDVGCGTGKHLFAIAKIVETGAVAGVDISEESLKKCQQRIHDEKFTNITLHKADLTELKDKLPRMKFDRILSSFAIYYTKNAQKTFSDIYELLSDKGILFVCGPTEKNNTEFLELVKKSGGNFSDDFLMWSGFLEKHAKNILEKLFEKVETHLFNNPLEFPDESALYKYWAATPHHKPELAGKMAKLIAEEFQGGRKFVTNKVIVGLKCKKYADACSFTLAHYKYCLALARQNGYDFTTMADYVSRKAEFADKKIILLRHDIDHKLPLALNFADVEKELGITSTYFIRLHAGYNPFSFESYKIIKALLDMNHELGLHYDCDFASLFSEDSEEFIVRDKAAFENAIGRKISGVSSHEPNKSKLVLNDGFVRAHGFEYHAYSDTFLKEMKYISDSSSRWREGCMCNFIKAGAPKLCILTHPIWWYKNSPLENY